jgi:hypothetical protein
VTEMKTVQALGRWLWVTADQENAFQRVVSDCPLGTPTTGDPHGGIERAH